MQADWKKFRKRPFRIPEDKSPSALTLRQIGEAVQRRHFAVALSRANLALADPTLTGPEQARVLALVADNEFKRGRFMEASQIQLQAAARSVGHATLWLRAHIGQVRALLKVPHVDQAVVMARHAVALAEAKMTNFNERVRLACQELSTNGTVGVPPLPPRVSVVATRLGYLFLQEGEPDAAEEFFQKAVQSSRGRANHARLGLAQIALAKSEWRPAIRASADAIRLGGYKAKTLSAWTTMIAARRHLGGWRISDNLIHGLDSAPAGLRARSILTIVRELRKNNMRQWLEVAEWWSKREGAKFPIIEAELRKMILASAKTEPGNAQDIREKAGQLLWTPGLSPSEWLAGAKEWVRASLGEGRNVQIQQLLAAANAQYGSEFARKAAHSLALSCMRAGRHDLARPILQANVWQLAANDYQWGKSVWALAKMESQLGNKMAAAGLYRRVFEELSTPVRFRLQAQLLWAEAMVAAGQPVALREARPLMDATLAKVTDPDILMNFARQLSAASPGLEDWGAEWFAKGAMLARQRFQDASHPSVAIGILFRLTRRQICDFDRALDAIQLWETMDEEKKDWLWSGQATFWEYLGLLVRAYCMERRFDQAESFAQQWLQDPATPPAGRVPIGIPYGQWLVRSRRMPEALALFAQLLADAPTHPQCALAWYWKALEAHQQQNVAERNRCISCLRLAVGVQGRIQPEQELCAKATLLRADLDVAKMDAQAVGVSPNLLPTLRLHILKDLTLLP